jgi:hypothetical protein
MADQTGNLVVLTARKHQLYQKERQRREEARSFFLIALGLDFFTRYISPSPAESPHMNRYRILKHLVTLLVIGIFLGFLFLMATNFAGH